MRTIALFVLLSLIFYSTYYVMKHKLDDTENEVEIRYKEVPKLLIDEQYDFNRKDYFDTLRSGENLWKINVTE